MKLTSLYTNAPEYIEFGWVCAPNAAAQSISAKTITKLTLDTEVHDTGSLVSAPSSDVFTLPAGTYYFNATTAVNGTNCFGVFYLYNGESILFKSGLKIPATSDVVAVPTSQGDMDGQFTIATSDTFSLRILTEGASKISNGTGTYEMTLATAGVDQRTTIKLWKVK